MMTKQDTAGMLAVLSSGFPHVTVTKETARVYHEVLVDLDPSDVMTAVSRLLKTSEWFPSAATIRKTTLELSGRLADTASKAWGEVLVAVQEYGYTRHPDFDSKLLQEAVRRIGWRTICHSEKPEVVRSQFVKVYDELREAHDLMVVCSNQKELEVETVRPIEAKQAVAAEDPVEG